MVSKDQDSRIQVVSPYSRSNAGFIKAFMEFGKEIWEFRGHIRIVFGTRFRAAYSGTGLGIVWNYVLPIIPLTVYLLLSRLRVFPDFNGVDSATFIAFGVTLWFLFTGCIQIPIQTIQSRNIEAMKTSLPISASIMASFAQLSFDTLVRVCFVVCLVAFTDTIWTWKAFLLPLLIAPALFGFFGMGLCLGILNLVYNDVSRVTSILLQYGIFISGVIFPIANLPVLGVINDFNPFAIYIDAARSVAFLGGLDSLMPLLSSYLGCFLIFIIAIRVFFVMEKRVRGIE
tara:strand:+ start:515 stop:1372 length:858 start_codon:yes stop_codon:yes gene_type:complete